MSWFGSSNNTNTNNNNNNNSGWNFGSNNNNNTNNNASNSSFNWNGNNNSNNNNMNNANNRQAQFVTKQTRFQSLPDDKKKSFMEFENNIILATSNKKQELDGTIKKLEQLPDIEHSLEMYAASTALLLEKLASYRHELEPFTTKLKKEFVYASQVQVDVQRQQSVHSSQIQHLPPPFYWDKINQFQQQLTDLRKQLENLQQHLLDSINNSQQTQVINTKSVTNALNAAHRSTLNIASQVIANHNVLQKLKEEYKKFRLQQFGDSHDPFHDTTPKKTSSVSTIQQYVNRGLELNGLQEISTNFGSNANQNQNQSNNFGQNTSSFSWGSNNNNSNNNNQNSNANNNQNNNNNSSAWNWGSNTNTNNNNNNSSSSSSNNNANSSGFNWGSSNNSNNTNSNNNSSFSFGNNNNNSNNSNNNTSGFSWGNTTNNSNNNSNASNAWTSNLQFRSNSFAA